MGKFKYDKKKALDHTDQGLDVFAHYYPKAVGSGKGRFKKFMLNFETENTPSSHILPRSKWGEKGAIIKSFHSNRSFDCFSLVMEEENMDFGEAIKFIYELFNIDGAKVDFKKKYTHKLATEDQKLGECYFDFNEKISKHELEYLGPLVTAETLEPFKVKSAKSYTRIKKYDEKDKLYKTYGDKPVAMTRLASEDFPILVLDYGYFQKIIHCKDKEFRFAWAGLKPRDFIFGMDTLPDLLEEYREKYAENIASSITDVGEEHDDKEIQDPEKVKLPWVLIGCGDRDSFNTASMGYPVVWKNSETAKLGYEDYNEIKEYAEKVGYVGDLDVTGQRETKNIGMQFLDLHIVQLPKSMLTPNYRKPGKDLTDYVKMNFDKEKPETVKNGFDVLVETSLPCQFWFKKYDDKKKFKGYDINNESLDQFLQFSGFYKFEDEDLKEDYIFIKNTNNVLEETLVHNIKDYPLNYLRSKNKSVALRNAVHRSNQISDKKLSSLPTLEPCFETTGKNHQYFFFNNKALKATKTDVVEINYQKLDIQVWKKHIIDHDINFKKEKPFEIFKDKDGDWDIKINHKNNHVLNFLINASRIHWRVCGYTPFKLRMNEAEKIDEQLEHSEKRNKAIELIKDAQKEYLKANNFKLDEEGLTKKQIKEQKLCLINKLFAFGYGLHEEKTQSKPWMTWSMDNKVSRLSASEGRSGKSLLMFQALKSMFPGKFKYKNARKITPKTNTDFVFDGITKETSAVCFDDANEYFPIDLLYTNATGDFEVNPKGRTEYTIPYESSPKIHFTSNFGAGNVDPSTIARTLFLTYSDYYHAKNEFDDEAHKVSDDFDGMELFKDFNNEQNDDWYSFAIHCFQFYLNCDEKIDPPMGNVDKRNLLQQLGDNFVEWADQYFTSENTNVNILRRVIFKEYQADNQKSTMKTGTFKSKLKTYCDFRGYIFNPPELCNSDLDEITGKKKKIVTKDDNNKSAEAFFIKTNGRLKELTEDSNNESEIYGNDNDDDFDPTKELS